MKLFAEICWNSIVRRKNTRAVLGNHDISNKADYLKLQTKKVLIRKSLPSKPA